VDKRYNFANFLKNLQNDSNFDADFEQSANEIKYFANNAINSSIFSNMPPTDEK